MFDLRSAASDRQGSLSNQMRSRRFQYFEQLVDHLPRPLHIIDIGGTAEFWEQRGWAGRDDAEITAVNLKAAPQRFPNIQVVKGDATNLSEYSEGQFDVAFSNSVIEHVFTKSKQFSMASEVQRVAKAFWVQTPNFWFPMEPHFHVPGWQWMPRGVRVAILRKRRCGWRGPCPDLEQARAAVDEVRLMTRSELRRAFPDAGIWTERLYGLPKSFVAYDGFGKSIKDLIEAPSP
ncbi:MAG: class I SAM-dependent methyltransferase [Phycisphaerales bacterium]